MCCCCCLWSLKNLLGKEESKRGSSMRRRFRVTVTTKLGPVGLDGRLEERITIRYHEKED